MFYCGDVQTPSDCHCDVNDVRADVHINNTATLLISGGKDTVMEFSVLS